MIVEEKIFFTIQQGSQLNTTEIRMTGFLPANAGFVVIKQLPGFGVTFFRFNFPF